MEGSNITDVIENLTNELPDEYQVFLAWFENNFAVRRNRMGDERRTPLFLRICGPLVNAS